MKANEAVDIYAISLDEPAVSRKFAEEIAADGRGKVAFALLSDAAHRTIDAYGLRDPAYTGQKVDGIPHPAVYVIDKRGRVSWARIESDYKKRPTNDEIRAAINALK